jgi:hypothetical protein
MSKAISNKNISAILSSGLSQGKELWEQLIPDKKLLKKYENLLQGKLQELKNSERLEELVKPIRSKLEKSCMKPLEAKNLQEFSQRVVSVLRVQAKKQKKTLEKKIGKKFKTPPALKAKKPRTKKAAG